MKFIGVANGLHTTIARIFDDGTVAELTEATEFYADLDGWTAEAAKMSTGTRPSAETTVVPAVRPAARVMCVGLNYQMHADEAGLPTPEYPSLFGRWTPSLVVDGTPVSVPDGEPGLDWEVELAVIVGKPLYRVDEETALAGVFGYAAFNDLSARDHQMHSRLWTLGKNADRSGPISTIVTADEVGDPNAGLKLRTLVNDEVVQDGSTSNMIFPVGRILSYFSEVLTLNPGDIIATGTPDGVGFKRTPPRYLTPGDQVRVEIENVGAVSNHIVALT